MSVFKKSLSLIFLIPLIPCVAEEGPLAQADLALLKNPETAPAEIRRLFIAAGGSDKNVLTHFQLLEAKQKAGQAPLQVLAANTVFQSSTYLSSRDYPIDKKDALFAEKNGEVLGAFAPSLNSIHDSVLLVFDKNGKELRPFGGNNYINDGYLYDFDRDGLLDRADSTNYGLREAPNDQIQVFELLTIEPEPRTLLEVIFNWHPQKWGRENEWDFRCFDDDGDGIPEIAFGPKSSQNREFTSEIVFRYDKKNGHYSAGEIPENSHVYVMTEGETLAQVAAKGGLNYPEIDAAKADAKPISAQKPYQFKSLKGSSMEEIIAFFDGEKRRDFFSGEVGSFPDHLPENFWDLSPKKAAMALAEANRTPSHRARYELALDDRHELAPPKSGWLTFDWGSSACYSFSSEFYAVNFGVSEPVLLVFGHNSIGVVGQNPWADQPAHQARIIPLSEKEARFLADTIFWLDRVRSQKKRSDDGYLGKSFSTADGSVEICLFPTDEKAKKLAFETDWATSSVSGNWTNDYDKTVFVNLSAIMIRQGLKTRLGNRWQKEEKIEPHSLRTSVEERLAPRVTETARKKLSEDFSAILAWNQEREVPAAVLLQMIDAAEEEMLSPLSELLKNLQKSLPPQNAEETELHALRKRFLTDHFGDAFEDKPSENQKAHTRLLALEEKFRFDRAAVVREALERAIKKLDLAADPEKLETAAQADDEVSHWALTQLHKRKPERWAEIIASDFFKSDIAERRIIFDTLAAGHPDSLTALIAKLKAEEYAELILEIAAFHQKENPEAVADDIPILLTLVSDRKKDIYRRGEAMKLLPELDLSTAQTTELRLLLLEEMENPQIGQYGQTSLSYALNAITKMPEPSSFLADFLKNATIREDVYSSGFSALLSMTENNPEREKILTDYLRPHFKKSSGMMNDIFAKALAFDLRDLASEIANFASESPSFEDGDGAEYSGGKFAGPAGQKYHIAREITALWSETDPKTRAQMWLAFAVAHPRYFSVSDFDPVSTAMRQISQDLILVLPAEERKIALNTALKSAENDPTSQYDTDTLTWLKSLTD